MERASVYQSWTVYLITNGMSSLMCGVVDAVRREEMSRLVQRSHGALSIREDA